MQRFLPRGTVTHTSDGTVGNALHAYFTVSVPLMAWARAIHTQTISLLAKIDLMTTSAGHNRWR